MIWLGHEDDTLVQASLNGIVRWLASKYPDGWKQPLPAWPGLTHPAKYPNYLWRNKLVQGAKSPVVPFLPDLGNVAGLTSLCLCPWFGRGWVIQELALSSVAYMYWGHAQIDVDWIGFASTGVFNQGKLSNNSLRRCYALYYVRETQNGTTGGDTFHNLIGASQGFVFSDPRDRVYGLLGLYTCDRAVRDQSLFIEPDYEATAMECFQIKE